MSVPVDRDMIVMYLLQALDEHGTAELARRVAEDPAWAEALREEAGFDVLLGAALRTLVSAEEPVDEPVPEPPVEPPEPEPEPSWWASLGPWVRAPMVGAAVAMALLVALRVPILPAEPLPEYEVVAVAFGEVVTRGDARPAEDLPVFKDGSAMHLRFVPATAYRGEVDVAVWLDGAPIVLATDVSKKGTVDLYAEFGRDGLNPSPGPHRIEVRLAPKGGSSEDAERFVQEFMWRPSVD